MIPTHNRPEALARCVEAIAPQVDLVLVIDNASDPPAELSPAVLGPGSMTNALVVRDLEQPPNLSRMWNKGMDSIDRHKPPQWDRWDIAILNDDATVPPGWMDAVAGPMRDLGAAAACSVGSANGSVEVFGAAAVPSTLSRLTGWAFVLRGELKLRADERLRWWCGDDDLSAKARAAGGLVRVPGFLVTNEFADQTTTGVLAEQASVDMATFVEIWGCRPW